MRLQEFVEASDLLPCDFGRKSCQPGVNLGVAQLCRFGEAVELALAFSPILNLANYLNASAPVQVNIECNSSIFMGLQQLEN